MAALVNWGAFVDDKHACAATAASFRWSRRRAIPGRSRAGVDRDSVRDQLFSGNRGGRGDASADLTRGVPLSITDSRGIERPAPLFYISPAR